MGLRTWFKKLLDNSTNVNIEIIDQALSDLDQHISNAGNDKLKLQDILSGLETEMLPYFQSKRENLHPKTSENMKEIFRQQEEKIKARINTVKGKI
ncbi:MAG: hypothetical protein ABW189_07490 [Rickettsiales bacterium]